MLANLMNAVKGVGTGATGASTSGAFGPGGQNFLGGQGTAMGAGTVNEFGAGNVAGDGLASIMGKLQNMTPEQQLQISGHLAQFAAPPATGMQPLAPVTPQQSSYSDFMQPAGQGQMPVPGLRTPIGIGG